MARTQKTSTGSCVASAMALFSCSLDVCTRSLTLSMHHFKSILPYVDRPTTDRINCVCSRVCVYACGYTKKGRGTCASGNWTQPNRGYVNMPLPSECSVPPGHKTK